MLSCPIDAENLEHVLRKAQAESAPWTVPFDEFAINDLILAR